MCVCVGGSNNNYFHHYHYSSHHYRYGYSVWSLMSSYFMSGITSHHYPVCYKTSGQHYAQTDLMCVQDCVCACQRVCV